MINTYRAGQKLQVKIERFTNLGVVVSFGEDEGLVYNSDIFSDPVIGETTTAYVKEIREDGKIDMTFRKHGYKNYIDNTTDTVLNVLKKHNGKINVNDKSTPMEITRLFDMSKSQFKKAIGRLYKKRIIEINENGIRLVYNRKK